MTLLTGLVTDSNGNLVTGSLFLRLSQDANLLPAGGGPAVVPADPPSIFNLVNGVIVGPGAGPTWSVYGTDVLSPSGLTYRMSVTDAGGALVLEHDVSITGVSVDLGTLPNITGAPPVTPVSVLSGDTTGPAASNTVARIQGRSVASTAPADTNVLGWEAAGSRWKPVAASPLTTKGDIYSRTSSAVTRVAIGSDGMLPVADSTKAAGWEWKSVPGTGPFVRTDGSTPLVGNWNAGLFDIQSKNSMAVFNVKAYGALGTGGDDTTAIQAAINAASAQGGGIVFFPDGLFVGHWTITGNNVHLQGSGITVLINNNNAAWTLDIAGNGHVLSDLILVHATPGQDATHGAIRVTSGGVLGDRLRIGVSGLGYDYPRIGVQATGVGSGVTLRDSSISNTYGSGIQILAGAGIAGTAVQVLNCASASTGADGMGAIVFDGCLGANIFDFQTYGSGNYGWVIQNTGGVGNTNLFMDRCAGDTSMNDNWHFTNATRVLITNGWAATNKDITTHVGATGFFLAGVSNLQMVNCISLQNNANGFYAGTGSSISIIGSIAYANSRSAVGVAHGFLCEPGVTNLRLVGNRAFDDGARPGGVRQSYGLALAAGGPIANWVIADNDWTGNLAGAYTNAATFGASVKLKDNLGINPLTVSTPAVPATTVAATNTTGVDVTVYLAGGTVSAVTVNGVVTGFTTNASFVVPAGGTIAVTYTVLPTWVWIGS